MEAGTPHNWSYLNFKSWMNDSKEDSASRHSIPRDSTYDEQISTRHKKINWKMWNPMIPEP